MTHRRGKQARVNQLEADSRPQVPFCQRIAKDSFVGFEWKANQNRTDRQLVVNAKEASFVRRLFDLYLELGSVAGLKNQLDRGSIRSKERISAAGNRFGDAFYSRGALYRILQNRIYAGEIQHRGKGYPGEHSGIIPRELWDQVQVRLRSDNQGRRNGLSANCASLLVGLLQGTEGYRFTPSHTAKNGKRYRYYVYQRKTDAHGARSKPLRLPAHDVEKHVSFRL